MPRSNFISSQEARYRVLRKGFLSNALNDAEAQELYDLMLMRVRSGASSPAAQAVRQHLKEALLLLDDARLDGVVLPPEDYSVLATQLATAGDEKVHLFAAMKRLGRIGPPATSSRDTSGGGDD